MSSVVTLYGMKELTEDRVSEFKVDWLDPKLNIGIEIEVEYQSGTDMNPEDMNLWSAKTDGSLRNGREFVLTRPLNGYALSSAIEEFFEHNTVRRSPTSGTHIHVDMRDKSATLDVAKTMGCIIACIEPAIFGMFAEGREWSGYTNPITSLPDPASYSLFSDLATPEDFSDTFNPITREYKYYGFNMLPLGRYGSVEFRYFPTCESVEELVEWVQFCMAVKLAAVQLEHRANLKYYISNEVAWEEFLNKFFPQWRDRMLGLLPQKEVSVRYRQARARLAKGVLPNKKVSHPPTATDNPFKDTRFKKFFAVKLTNDQGKSKLAYDLSTIALLTPVRVYIDNDVSASSNARDGDWLVGGNYVYRYLSDYGGWREQAYFTLGLTGGESDRIVEEFRPITQAEMLAFGRAVVARLSGNIAGYGNVADLSNPNSVWRTHLNRVLNMLMARYNRPAEPEPPSLEPETEVAPPIPVPIRPRPVRAEAAV